MEHDAESKIEVGEHKCPENRFADKGIKVLHGPSVDNDWQDWILEVASIANEKAVQDGQAEFVGEILWQSQFVIAYCPFCGMRLE